MSFSLIEPEPSETPDVDFWGDGDGGRDWRSAPGPARRPSPPRPARPARRPGILSSPRDPRLPGHPWWSILPRWTDRPARRGNQWLRRHMTARQQAGALLLVAAGLAGVALYVAVLAATEGHSFTGAVTGNGLVDLNFARPGQVAEISVRVGQNVTSGQVLATEAATAAAAAVAADEAAIQADEVALAQFGQASEPEPVNLAAAQAKLAKDKAQLAVDQAAVIGMRIVAPMNGTVIAVNGQVGETVTAVGIAAAPPGSAASQQVATSQGSQISVTSAVPVPVIMLRTSRNWQVQMVVPENSAWTVKPGTTVAVAVPAAHLSGIPGRVEGLLPTPVRTAQGVGYQVLVTVVGHQPDPPLSGMAAEVRPAS